MPTVSVHPMICGRVCSRAWAMDVWMPVPAYLVEHPAGLVLVDTGMHPSIAVDAAARLGARVAADWPVRLDPSQAIAARLAALGVDPRTLALVLLTHLHFDHAGGLHAFPGARVLVQRPEWEAAHDAAAIEANGYVAADYEGVGAPVLPDGDHDVFGDGAVVCLATPGHSPGHQSVLLALADGPLLLAADACFFAAGLDGPAAPMTGPDTDAELRSLERVRGLRDAGVAVLPGHDPAIWRRLPAPPEPLNVAALRAATRY